MAGHKFQNPRRDGTPALRCPRMSHKLYTHLRDKVIAELQVFFEHVIVSTEAPEKLDHGDVDLLVCSPKGDLKGMDCLEDAEVHLAGALQVTRSTYDRRNGVLFMGRPISAKLLDHEYFLVAGSAPELWPGQTHPEPHVQLDIMLCDAPSQLGWYEFRQAHGDLSNIIQTGLQDAGFSFKPSGLHVRIPEIESVHENESFLFLSNNVQEVLAFFGMQVNKYGNRFTGREELFCWIASCNYFTRTQLVLHPQYTQAKESGKSAVERLTLPRTLKTYFEYMDGRGMYADFAGSFLLSHPEIGARLPKERDEILHHALQQFNAYARYIVTLTEFNARQKEAAFWGKISTLIPELLGAEASKTKITTVSEGLKRFVYFDSVRGLAKRPVLLKEPQMIKELQPRWTDACEEGGLTEDELLNWIGLHWERVYQLERKRDKPRRHLLVEKKEARKAVKKTLYWRAVAACRAQVALLIGLGYAVFELLIGG